MSKQRRRWYSVLLFVVLSLAMGCTVGVAAAVGRPEAVRRLWSIARIDARGDATVTESIDYSFSHKRHGIFRVLPDVPYSDASQVTVHSDAPDQMQVMPEANGIRIRIGDPSARVSGDHRYEIDYPLRTIELDDGQFGWNGVGTSWEVPIEHSELDVVAPWRWTEPSCVIGVSGSVSTCTITQPEPGHLVVSTGRSTPGHGVTIYAKRGVPLGATPAPRTPAATLPVVPWWQRPITLGMLAAVLLLASALVAARLLRRAGRDRVMAGPASTGDAAGVAFGSGVGRARQARAGTMRVDDTELAGWATTEFAPPKGITAWQGGVLAAEKARSEHRVAWLLGAAVDGYIELDDRDPKAVVVKPLSHTQDKTASLLAVAFAGRTKVRLGKYDSHFAALWTSLSSVQSGWFKNSGFADLDAERRANRSVTLGIPGIIASTLIICIGAFTSSRYPMASLVAVASGAVLGGLALAAVLRGWELRVRTPAGSATWLRVESFRRFLANSEAHHVVEAAKRGVLREYTAWAVALDEVDHWSKMVDAATLPPDTVGLHSALFAPAIARSFASAGTVPSTSGGGGGGSFDSGISSMSVGGGGGGGGGGSW